MVKAEPIEPVLRDHIDLPADALAGLALPTSLQQWKRCIPQLQELRSHHIRGLRSAGSHRRDEWLRKISRYAFKSCHWAGELMTDRRPPVSCLHWKVSLTQVAFCGGEKFTHTFRIVSHFFVQCKQPAVESRLASMRCYKASVENAIRLIEPP